MAKKTGRPPEEDPLVNPIPVRFRASQRDVVERAAAQAGVKLAAWVREAAVARAEAELGQQGEQ